MDTRQFILDTLLPYKQDPTTCGYYEGTCSYLTNDGKKCAVGKHLIEGKHQKSQASVWGLEDVYGLKNILTDEAKAMNLDIKVWSAMQSYHDNLSSNEIMWLNSALIELERLTDLKFPELYIETNS